MPVRDRTGISGLKGIGVAALILGLAGCADREQRMFFDGNYYPASSRRTGGICAASPPR